MLNPVTIYGTNLPDVWHQTLYKAVEIGRDFTIDRGSFEGQKRKEFDYITIHAECPGVGELIPKINPALKLDDPVAADYLDDYMPYIMTGEEKEGESYTYGQRICKADPEYILNLDHIGLSIWGSDEKSLLDEEIQELYECKALYYEEGVLCLNQMELMIWTYKNKGYRNNQMIMQVGQPSDMALIDPPCLRHIDTRIQNNEVTELRKLVEYYKELRGRIDCTDIHVFAPETPITVPNTQARIRHVLKNDVSIPYPDEKINKIFEGCKSYELHFLPYFRSWDLWGGFPANLAAIELMKQYCAGQIGVENGGIIASSKGLHLYNYVWEIAEMVRGRSSDEFKEWMTV